MTRLLRGLVTLVVLGVSVSDAAAQARVVRHASASLGSERIFSILLPSGYADSDKRYPVVYLFHGGGQDHTAFMARPIFRPLARMQEAIFVMPAADRNYSSLVRGRAGALQRLRRLRARGLRGRQLSNDRVALSRGRSPGSRWAGASPR